MKIFKNQFKTAFLLIVLIVNTTIYGQTENSIKETFVRVYNLNGKKLNKGKVFSITDSTLILKKSNGTKSIDLKIIGMLKTKRSAGNNILIGSLIGGASGALIGAATSEEETKTKSNWLFGEYEYTSGTSPGEGAAIGGGLGIIGGALVGAGISIFKKSQTFEIDGDKEKLKQFKKIIE